MKLDSTLSLLGILFIATLAPAAQTATRILACELEDTTFQQVVDRNSTLMDQPVVLLLLGNPEVMGTVRDVSQPSTGDHKLEITMTYHGASGTARAHAETTYILKSAPLNSTLAEASTGLSLGERRYTLRCFLQAN